MRPVLSSLPYTDGVYASPSSFNQFGSNSAGLKREKDHTHTRQKSLNKSQESYSAGSSGEPGGRRKAGLLPRARGAGTALPAPRGARPRPPSLPTTLSRRGYLQVGRGGRHGGDPRRLPGEGLGRRQATGDVDSHLERPERTQASGLEPRGCLPRELVRKPPGTQTAPDPPHRASASQPPRRARVPPLPQNFRFRHQHAPHPVPDCRGLAFALGLARPGRGSLNPAEAWQKSSCAQAHYGSAEPVGPLAVQGCSCFFLLRLWSSLRRVTGSGASHVTERGASSVALSPEL